jgi:diacylglycerol O-acyltransferase
LRQLSGTDAAFLQMETPTTYAHVALVAVFSPAPEREPLTLPELRQLLAARIHRAPVLRQRLLTVPWELDRPYWVDDPDFSLDRHLHTSTLPGPGDDHRLSEHVSRLVARPLDRSRPLWELHLVHGLADGRFSLVGIVHHAAADGVMGRDLLATLLDLEPAPPADPPPPPWRPEPVPGPLVRLLRGVVGHPLRVAALQRRIATRAYTQFFKAGLDLPQPTAGQQFQGLLSSLPMSVADSTTMRRPAPRTLFNRAVSGRRAWAFAQLPRDRVRQVRQATDTSANEVLLAVTAGALRRWLTDHGGVPGTPLRALVPVSTRPRDRAEDGSSPATDGNAVSFMVTELPTDHADPARRLRTVASSTRQARATHERHDVAASLTTFADLTVPGLVSAAARLANAAKVTDWIAPAVNLVVSSVPGPTFPLYLRGARLLAGYPVSVVTDGFGLNVTLLATEHHHDVGLTACPELVPDLWQLAAGFEPSLDELVTATRRS